MLCMVNFLNHKLCICAPNYLLRSEQVATVANNNRVVYKSRQLAKFAGFSARFRRLLSLLHESKYVEEMDPQPSTFHKTPAT